MLEALIVATFTALGVITQRVVGFGIAAFLSPVALIFFLPARAVTLTLLVGTLSCFIVLFDHRRKWAVIKAVIFRLFVAAIPGSLLGAYIVTRIDKGLLQIVLGLIVIAGVLVQEYAFPKPIKPLGVTKGISVGGFAAGFLNAVAANGAAAVILWMRSHISTASQIRQNFAALAILVNAFSMTAIFTIEPQTFKSSTIMLFMLLVPVVFAANIVGARLAERVNSKQYEKLVVVAIILTGLVSMALGVASYA